MPHFIRHQLVIRTLEHVSDTRPLLPDGDTIQLSPVKEELTFSHAIRRHCRLEVPEQRRFTTAGLAADYEEFALFYGEIQIPERRPVLPGYVNVRFLTSKSAI